MASTRKAPQPKQAFRRERGVRRDPVTGVQYVGAMPDHSRLPLDALVEKALHHEWGADFELARRVSDPQARDTIENVLGGKSPLDPDVTRLRIDLGLRSSKAFATRAIRALDKKVSLHSSPSSHDDGARTLITLATQHLRLDPDAVASARALTRLFSHEGKWTRAIAVREAANLLRDGMPRTAARDVLREKLGLAIKSPEDQLFIEALPAFGLDPSFGRRVDRLLRHEDPWIRRSTAYRLMQSSASIGHIDRLIRWLREPGPLDVRLEFAGLFGAAVPVDTIRELATAAIDDPSPSHREEAIGLVRDLPGPEARRLLTRALRDEPDASLRRLITRALKRLKRVGTTRRPRRSRRTPPRRRRRSAAQR